jgi:hypothetical protein
MMDICFRIKTKLLYLYELYKHTSFHTCFILFSSYSASFVCVVILIILAYFPKMKVGLSNPSLSMSCMCPPLITFEPLGRFS